MTGLRLLLVLYGTQMIAGYGFMVGSIIQNRALPSACGAIIGTGGLFLFARVWRVRHSVRQSSTPR